MILHKIPFIVYIIESPSKIDLFNMEGLTGGRLLSETFKHSGIPYRYNLTTDQEMLNEALKSCYQETCIKPEQVPILHLHMHGKENGLGLTNGDILEWYVLKKILLPLQYLMNGRLIICTSSCYGFYSTFMALPHNTNEPPFYAIVGNTDKPSYAEAAVAYTTFYHLLFNGLRFEYCIDLMNKASNNYNFHFKYGVQAANEWIELVQAYNWKQITQF